MFERILVICDGNICRSPAAAFLLAARTGRQVESAGLVGLEGQDMDATMRSVTQAKGQAFPVHVARRLTHEMCRDADLILVMEKRQKDRIAVMAPEVSGKVMLLGHWQNQEIPDPYRKSREAHEHAWQLIEQAVESWVARLG